MKTQPKQNDPYNMPRRIECAKNRLRKNTDISEADKKLILGYDEALELKQVSLPHREKELIALTNIAVLSKKPFKKQTKTDVKKVVALVLEGKVGGKERQARVLATYKRFFKWMKDPDEEGEGCPIEVKWIKARLPKNPTINPDELIRVEDVRKAADNTINLRDRAFILTLWESGCRISEFLSLRLRDIEEGEDIAYLNIQQSKTKLRKVPVYYHWPDLKRWMKTHPARDNRDNPLWCNLLNGHAGEVISYTAANHIVRKAFSKAGVNGRKTNLHAFRHSSISYFLQARIFTVSEVCQKYWGSAYSPQVRRYGHIDIYQMGAKLNGKKKEAADVKACPYCGRVNMAGAVECSGCEKPLDYRKQAGREKLTQHIMADFFTYLQENPDKAKEFTEMFKEVN